MEIALLVLETAGMLKKAAAELFKDFGLSPAQFNVLHLLADQPQGLRAGELASGLLVDPSNITGLLTRLVRDGLVADGAATTDGRSRVVKLTTKGRARWAKAHAAYARALGKLESVLTANERTVVAKALSKLGRNCHDVLD
ncbi:MAG TPA: MarR family transcriptional regulator [Opitutaceae bacterium]|nr:MarR family transcriptional regulator [Opitutaceae bacterium]